MKVSGSASNSPVNASARVVLVLGSIVFLAAVSPAGGVGRADRIPPKFSGLESAVTCIPGPIGGNRTTSYHLSWTAATDNVTPSRRIVYEVYQATVRGGQNLSFRTYRTRPGVTSFNTPQLTVNETFYFVVRARDLAGNRDSNTVEREGQNLCV